MADAEDAHTTIVSPSLSGPEIFHRVAREGREELERPLSSLWWSAVAAGLVISLSAVCKGFLHAAVPDVPWRNAVSSVGYTVGFVIVVLGRLQLFTENTITTVLPVLEDRTWNALKCTLRLWGVVWIGNLIGCLVVAALIVYVRLSPDAQHDAIFEVARHYAERSGGQMLAHGVPAGFLVAAMVWSAPAAAGGSRFWVIVLLSYFISAGNLTHVVAGSTELLVLVLDGELDVASAFLRGILPTGLGNVLGGTVFFALLAYGQARDELEG